MMSGSASVGSGWPKSLNHKKPSTPAVSDARRMAIFDAVMWSACPGNAKLVMKIDIVNPTPPCRPKVGAIDLDAAIAQCLSADGPFFLDVAVAQTANCFPMIPRRLRAP
jgi:hypothetical protein